MLVSLCIMNVSVQAIEQKMEDSGISYQENPRVLENPDGGFYSIMPILCTPKGTEVKDS